MRFECAEEQKRMNVLLYLLVLLGCLWTVAADDEALDECSKVHHIDMYNVANANATFDNSKSAQVHVRRQATIK